MTGAVPAAAAPGQHRPPDAGGSAGCQSLGPGLGGVEGQCPLRAAPAASCASSARLGWAQHPRRLLGRVPELLSAAWQVVLATVKHKKGSSLSWKEKRGCPIPSPALCPCPTLERRCGRGGGVSQGRSAPRTSPCTSHLPRPAEPPEPRSPAAKLPARAPPGARGWQRCYFSWFSKSSFKFLCAAAAGIGTPPHRVAPRLWRAALRRLRSCDNQQQGQVSLRGGGTSAHLHPQHPPAASGMNRDCQPWGSPVFWGGTRRRCRQPQPLLPPAGAAPEPHEPLGTGPDPAVAPCPAPLLLSEPAVPQLNLSWCIEPAPPSSCPSSRPFSLQPQQPLLPAVFKLLQRRLRVRGGMGNECVTYKCL